MRKADSGLYETLRKRKLLDRIIPESANAGRRDWKSMSDDEVVDHAQRVVDEKDVNNRRELQKADSGLYNALLRRGLMDRVIPESAHAGNRDWSSMGDDEIVEYAHGLFEEKGLMKRSELERADCGLYKVLLERRLLDAVFAQIDSQKKREAVRQVVDAMKEFDHQ